MQDRRRVYALKWSKSGMFNKLVVVVPELWQRMIKNCPYRMYHIALCNWHLVGGKATGYKTNDHLSRVCRCFEVF